MILAVAGLLLALSVASPADLKGKWEGKVTGQREDGSAHEDSVLLILDQKDTTVTGSVGNESEQHPITSGTVEGNKVSLVVKSAAGREYQLELTVENDELKGSVTSGARKMQLQARKRKE